MGEKRKMLGTPEGLSPRDVEQLYREHFRRIFAFAYGRIEDREQALELAQEVFLRFFEGERGPTLPDREVTQYLYGIARHVVADFLAGRSARPTLSIENTGPVPASLKEPGVDALLVEKCLGRLNETDRTIMTQYFYRGDTHREIASRLGMREGSVRQRFRRALRKLRAWLGAADL